jgi:GTP-binding protein YchF
MSFSVGIVGLPNVGKSTLFKALTKKQVDIAAYPFTTISPNVGIVPVPDERLEKIAQIVKPEKITPAIIEFVDIAGLVKGAHRGEGLGNQFLAKIRECEAILEVVRAFEGEEIEHLEKTINPERDIEIIKTELIMKDLETANKCLQKLEGDLKKEDKVAQQKFKIIKKIKEALSQEKLISKLNLSEEEISQIKDLQFLTLKPIIHVFNISEKQLVENPQKFRNLLNFSDSFLLDLKIEEEISELSESEKKEIALKPQIDQLILICYNILDLITFYTIAGGKETRAWALERGSSAQRASRKVHSDFQEKFIKAEVIPWQKLIEAGSLLEEARLASGAVWQKAREKGWLRTEGKDYIIQDGDVIEFKI